MPSAFDQLLAAALSTGREAELRFELLTHSGLPGPRLHLGPVREFARAVGEAVVGPLPSASVQPLERLLDGWAAMNPEEAPGDQPAVILPCAAVAAYGEVGAVRPDWWDDEITKLRRAAVDTRWRVRELVAQALQRMLGADWQRTVGALAAWAGDEDLLVVRAAAAAVSQPRLLAGDGARAGAAAEVQRLAVAQYRGQTTDGRTSESGRVLRQALGFTISVTTAATGDFSLLEGLAVSGDPDGAWIARHNLRKARLQPWPDRVEGVRRLLATRGPAR